MWDMGPAADAALRSGSWTSLARVDVLNGGRPVASLSVSSGSVGAEAGRAILRNVSATLVDPTGALSVGDVDDLLNAYDCEIAPYRGVRVTSVQVATAYVPNEGFGLQPFGVSGFGGVDAVRTPVVRHTDFLAPLGVFQLTSRQLSGEGSVTVAGQDRAIVYQGSIDGPLAIRAGTPVEEAIERLLAARNPGVTFAQTWVTGFTVGPLLFDAGINVWSEAQTLAKSVGGWLFHDRMGGLVFASLLPTSDRPVARFADEPRGRLVQAERSESSDPDEIQNVVVVESAKAGLAGVIRAVVEDTDPSSPTYARGRYGRRSVTISNQHVGSVEQAQQMGAAELARRLGRSETATATVIVDPRLDPLDVAIIHRPSAGLTERALVLASVDVPLGVDEPMRLGLHRSIRAQDGRVVDVPLELAG